jgi:hypothetical protein
MSELALFDMAVAAVVACSVQGGYANDRAACCTPFAEPAQGGLRMAPFDALFGTWHVR